MSESQTLRLKQKLQDICTAAVSNGGEARDGAHFHSGYSTCLDAGDTDALGAEVAEAGFQGVDAHVLYIAPVSEPNRDADEEGADKHEGLLGGGGSSHQTQPTRCMASYY